MKKLARISKATLQIKDHSILTFWIHVDYEEGCSQGVGGIVLDRWDEEKKGRVGTAYGCEIIRRLLLALNVDDFSEMEGKMVWVIGDGEGLSFKPTGIQPLDLDNNKNGAVVFSEILIEGLEFEVEQLNLETNDQVKHELEQIMSQRERILEAFIAETGLLPSQCQQVIQDGKWWVEKLSIAE